MMKIAIITSILAFCVSCNKSWFKDDKLSLPKQNYSSSELKINGYYYQKYGNPEKIIVYFFYSDGTLLHAGGGYEINDFEQIITSQEFINKLHKMKDCWGLFTVNSKDIQFERWYPSERPLSAYVRSGTILNDTTFIITESYRMKRGKKKDVSVKNETYYFKQFSPKPDSTNEFIK